MHTFPAVRTGRVHDAPPKVIRQPRPACLTDGLDRLEEPRLASRS